MAQSYSAYRPAITFPESIIRQLCNSRSATRSEPPSLARNETVKASETDGDRRPLQRDRWHSLGDEQVVRRRGALARDCLRERLRETHSKHTGSALTTQQNSALRFSVAVRRHLHKSE